VHGVQTPTVPPWGGGVPYGAAPGASGGEFGGVRDCAGPGAIIPPGKKKGPSRKLTMLRKSLRKNRLRRALEEIVVYIAAR